MVPVSTGTRVITPPAFDFTSTTLIGSTTPDACASMTMSRRWTPATVTGSDLSLFPEHAAATTRSAAPNKRFTKESPLNGPEWWAGLVLRKNYEFQAGNADLLQVLPDNGLDLGPGGSVIETRLNQRLPGRVEGVLRRGDLELRGRAEVVPLLLHAKVFLRGLYRQLLDVDALFGRAKRGKLLEDILLREKFRVAERGFLVQGRRLGAMNRLGAIATIPQWQARAQAESVAVGELVAAD